MNVQVRDRLRLERVSGKRVSFGAGVDKTEVAAAALTAVLVITTVLYYFLSLGPLRGRLADARAKEAAQTKVIGGGTSQPPPSKGTSPKEQIELAKGSLDEFKEHWLKPVAGGRIEIINEINELVAADKVHLGGGIDMHLAKKLAAEGGESGGSQSGRPKKTDLLDIYPKTEFRFSVIGRYDDVRKFLKDLQGSKNFLIIDSIGLADVEGKQGGGRRAAVIGAGGIQLTTTVTAYFRPQ